MRTGISYCPADGDAFVAAQVVEHDDVARPQGWHKELWTEARTAAIDGPSNTQGATMPLRRNAATKVMVVERACGTDATRRSPRDARPCVRVMLVSAHASSTKIRRRGSTRCWWRFHRSRLRATSGRSCSVARRLFLR